MRTQLVGWCVLLVVAGGSFAADKPKGKKGKPAVISPPVAEELLRPSEAPKSTESTSNTELGQLAAAGMGSVAGVLIGKAPGNPKTGAVVGPLGPGLASHDADHSDTAFTITKPVGTWARDLNMGDAICRFTLIITEKRLTLKIDGVNGEKTANGRVDVDYSINKESMLFGVIDSCEVKSSEKMNAEQLGPFAKLSGQPFAVRFRVEDDGLTFKDFKGLGVGLGEKEPEFITSALTMLNGRFTKVDPSKPLPPLKAGKKPVYPSDPLLRQDQLLRQGEDIRKVEEMHPLRSTEQPKHLTPQRIHGGILKADPPKEDDDIRLGGTPYPTPHYLHHYPRYVGGEPVHPLHKDFDTFIISTNEFDPGFVTTAYAGPVAAEWFRSRPLAEFVSRKPNQ